MKYKNAAGLYVGGISFTLASPLIVFIAMTFGTRAAISNPSTDLTVLFMGIGILGGLLGIVGIILLIGATYRALVKIDALQVMRPSSDRENWSADRR
ncbi:hypothetical protein [Paeniglutamicibacter sp. NPDC091659]|uniref:hypothetical protein n=1 Tax=Paeniglutamicibacter sp. NPDC091659 TaxID=3364389 RepID=UPI00382958AE